MSVNWSLRAARSSPVYKQYVLAAITTVFTLNYLDRCLVTLLLQPIKVDLQLSDSQLGFLTGIAFALFYATLGVPVARWADRGNRVTLTSWAIGLWGLTVMACMLVTNFVQMLFARIAAAVGEAGCMPPTYSLVGDYFREPAERTRAMAVYMMAGPLAVLISFSAGGWLNDHYGWRMTFFLMGVPGLLMAFLVKFTVAEPARQPNATAVIPRNLPRMTEVLGSLWHQQSARNLILGIILFWTLSQGLMPWYAAFMIRSHGMGTTELGLWLGLIAGIGGAIGIWLGGHVAARWLAHDERGQMRLSAMMIVAVVPCFIAFLLLPKKQHALLALIPLVVVFNGFLGPTFALMQRLVSDAMRATTLAVVLLLANLVGMGIGPQIVGIMSDLLVPMLGADSLRYSMLTMSFVAFWSGYHFWKVGNTVDKDLRALITAPDCQTSPGGKSVTAA